MRYASKGNICNSDSLHRCHAVFLFQFAVHVLNLLAVATEGRNRGTEVQTKALLPIADIVKIMHDCDGDKWPTVKVLLCVTLNIHSWATVARCCCAQTAVVNVFTHCYVDVERSVDQWHALGASSVWEAFSGISKDIAKLSTDYTAPAATYVFRSAVPCVLAYFTGVEDLSASPPLLRSILRYIAQRLCCFSYRACGECQQGAGTASVWGVGQLVLRLACRIVQIVAGQCHRHCVTILGSGQRAKVCALANVFSG